MAVTSVKTKVKSGSLLAGNSAYNPNVPIPALGAWTTAGSTVSAGDTASFYGWTLVGGTPRVFCMADSRSAVLYYNNGRGGTWTTGTSRPTGQALASSSKSRTNSDRFYTMGGDTGTQTLVYSTADGSSWRSETGINYNAGWSDGAYVTAGGGNYLYAVAEYPTGNTAGRTTVNSDGTLNSWSSVTNYPVYAAAPRGARLTSKLLMMGGFTSTSLSALRTNVYTMDPTTGNWTSETALPFTPTGGYIPAFSLTGTTDTRVYISNHSSTTLYSRGDSSGTWTTETSTPGSWSFGWGTVDSSGNKYVQVSNSGGTYYQAVN